MTEDEAKKKWCPYANVVSENFKLMGNRLEIDKMIPRNCFCIASNCMAWRGVPFGDDGYCGLAGKP